MTTPQNTQPPTQKEPMFAVFNGDKEITPAMYKEVLDFVEYVKAKESEK